MYYSPIDLSGSLGFSFNNFVFYVFPCSPHTWGCRLIVGECAISLPSYIYLGGDEKEEETRFKKSTILFFPLVLCTVILTKASSSFSGWHSGWPCSKQNCWKCKESIHSNLKMLKSSWVGAIESKNILLGALIVLFASV